MIAYELIAKENKKAQNERVNKRRAGILTLVVASAIFLFAFLIPIFFAPNPPLSGLAGGGSEIILGSTDYGMGETYELVAAGEPSPTISEPETTPPPPDNNDDILVTENKDDIAINVEKKDNKKIESPKTTTPEKKTENKTQPVDNTPKINKDILFKKSDKTGSGGTGGGNNTSKGTGDRPGDQGSKNGDPNSKSFEGGGKGKGYGGGVGDGIGLSGELKGREMIKRPRTTNVEVKGSIEFNINVDANGNVLNVSLKDKSLISLKGNAEDANTVINFFLSELKNNTRFDNGDYASGTIIIILDPK